MALEYTLRINTKTFVFNFIENCLNEKKISFSKEKINNGVNIFLYESFGFMISVLLVEKTSFDYLISRNQTNDEDWDYCNNVHFRLDKFYDNLTAKLNLVELCVYVLNHTTEDARLLFNGDILVLERTSGIVSINTDFGFWNSDELLEKIKQIM